MGPAAVQARLAEASALSDLRVDRRFDTKVDLSPDGITRRLAVQSRLREACLSWGRSTPVTAGQRSNPV